MINVFSDGGDGTILPVPYELVVIQDKLCLPVEGQAYGFFMDNGTERHQLYTFLMDNNVPDGCSGDSSMKLLATEALFTLTNGEINTFDEFFTPENVPPDCESFNYSRIGNTNWQCASVSGVHELFTVFNWQCIGYDWGIFTQPLYFQLPINGSYSLDSGSTKIESAAYLDMAFKAFDNWYKINGCNAGAPALEQKLLEYIKDEFEENGGAVTLNPPLGFVGLPTAYKVTWSGYGNCN